MEILPYFETILYTRDDLNHKTYAEKLVNLIWGEEKYKPSHLGFEKPYRSIKKIPKSSIIDQIVDEEGQKLEPDGAMQDIKLNRLKNPECYYWLRWTTLAHEPFAQCSYSIHKDDIIDQGELDSWVEFMLKVIQTQKVWYARFALKEESRAKNFISYQTEESGGRTGITHRAAGVDLAKGIPGVYWGNYFSKFYVDWFGKSEFLELDCHEMLWLKNGGVFFTVSETPFMWNQASMRTIEERIKQTLGYEAFFDLGTVKMMVEETEPVSITLKPTFFQSPRKIPGFPF